MPTAEGWLVPLVGQVASNKTRRSLHSQLGFDPIHAPHQMNTKKEDLRHAKRVLHALLDPDKPLKKLPASTPGASDTDEALQSIRLDLEGLRHLEQ